jgi:hypothetical protein
MIRKVKRQFWVRIMVEVLITPQFQVFTHQDTGQKTGRIYFPALFLAEFHRSVSQWLQKQEIIVGI